MAESYFGLFRAKALRLDAVGIISAYIPQVYGDTAIQIDQYVGSLPTTFPEMGWVSFWAGEPEHPVWHGGGGSSGGGGGGGTVTDTVWVGPDAPTDDSIELWWDTDESTQFATATDHWNSAWGTIQTGVMRAVTTLSATTSQLTDPLTIQTIAGRRYRLTFQTRAASSATAAASGINFLVYVDGALRIDLGDWYLALPTPAAQYNSTDWGSTINGDGASHSYHIGAKAIGVNATIYLDGSKFYIEDIGPVTRLPSTTPPPGAFDWTPYDARYVSVPTAWTPLVMNTPWTATNPYGFTPPAYRKIGDVVYLRGTTTSGSTGVSTSTISVLPGGHRPTLGLLFPAWMSWAGTSGRMAVRLEIDQYGQIIMNHTYSMPTATGVPIINGSAVDHLSFDGIFFSVTP